jgi:coenzyme F420-0:L-glutamate ligase/coenzyme F420-1:gamma-L-glutamate ligase
MSERIELEVIPSVPHIEQGDDIGEILLKAAHDAGIVFQENDVVCVASKAVSSTEGRFKSLTDVQVSEVAEQIQKKVPRKDARTVQVIIEETGALDGSRVEAADNYIAGWLPNGLRLTSSGVDKSGAEEVILLPRDPDMSAKAIGKTILEKTSMNVGVIITDSDGRVDKKGSTQVAIGVYGIYPLRVTEHMANDKVKKNEETTCDMLAASAGLIMGQRGTNKPIVLIRGHQYEFDEEAKIVDALVESNALESTIQNNDE